METAEKKTVWQGIRQYALSFLDSVKEGPDFLFYILVVLYISSQFLKRIAWRYSDYYSIYKTVCYFASMGCGAYLVYKILAWKKAWKQPVLLVLCLAASVGLSALFLWNLSNEFQLIDAEESIDNETYVLVMDIFLCLMAYGKNYKNLLKCLVFIPFVVLVIAGLGLALGYAMENVKPDQVETTRSLGIIYPNTWGYLAFQGLLLVWYLFLKKKALLTFLLFWAITAFMFFVVGCRTIAIMSACFPLIAILIEWAESRAKQREPRNRPGIIGWLVIALPVLCYALTIVLSFQMEWVQRVSWDKPYGSMAMRFVQGGIALEHYGFPLFGRPMTDSVTRFMNYHEETLNVMDNAYSTFTITKGMIWMVCCLAWLTAAQWRGWKKRDYGLMLMGGFMLVFALMERPGLEAWYNFVLYLPLASLADTAGKKAAPKLAGAPQNKTSYKKRKRR